MKKIIFFYFVFILINISKCIIVIPFKTFTKKEPENFNGTDVIFFWGKNIIYTDSLIGSPPQKISYIIESETFETNLYQHMCDILDSSYDKEKSNSFYIEKVINSHGFMKNASRINETLYFYDNLDKKVLKPFKNYKLVYSDNEKKVQGDLYEYHENTCINLGFLLNYVTFSEADYNIIAQLKKTYQQIETYDFSFRYKSDNEGVIVIGAEPHVYDPQNFYETQYRIVAAMGSNIHNLYSYDFYLNFDKVYFSYYNYSTKMEEKKDINVEMGVRIKFDMGVIAGPRDYEKLIREHFFEELFEKKKCYIEDVIDQQYNYKYHVFSCDKESTQEKIKIEFPTLYFEMKQFNKIFELNYKDLFREKNGKLYFLVYFKQNDYFADYFIIGKIFLKKYFFTFNQDTKMIGYYNVDLPNGQKDKVSNKIISFLKNEYLIIIVVILFIIFGVVGFFFGKAVYDTVRKKRVNELDDNYDYVSQDNNKNINSDEPGLEIPNN